MKKFLLLLVGVLFALSAKAVDYYLVGDAVDGWNSSTYRFTKTSTTGVYELEINGKVKAGTFKINAGRGDWTSVNIGAKGNSDVTISFGTAYDYDNNGSTNKHFNFPSEQSYAYFVLNTITSKLTVYNSKPLKAHVPSGNYCFFLNTDRWSTPHTYVWDGGSNNGWPGKAMSQYNDTKLYLWEDASLSFSPSKVQFNSGSNANKIDDLTFTNGAVYNPNGTKQSTFSNTYYFDIAGSAITTKPTLSIGWATVDGVETEKSGVYKFDLTTSIPTNYWEVSFTDGNNTYDSPLIVADNVYKVEGTNVVNKGAYAEYGAAASNYTIYFDAAGTAWDGATLTYADGQPTVTGTAVDGKAGVYSFSFESTLTESQMSVKVANSDKSFSAATFVNGHIYKLYRGALKDGGEYTAEYAVTIPVESTIYFTTEGTGWTGVKIHYWDNFGQSLTGNWGTTAMTKVEGTDNVWKYTIPADHMNVLCGIKFTDGYNYTEHETNTLYTDGVQAGHLYKINADWTVASQGLYTEPTTTYYYRLHGSIFTSGVKSNGDWHTQDLMAKNSDGTYSFTATIKKGSFGIKRLESESTDAIGDGNPWINSPSSVTMVADTEYPAQVKNNNGADFYTELSGKYTIVFNPTTMKVKIVSPTVTPSNYSYRFHSNMVNGTWPADDNNDPAWKMTEQPDGTWMWEGPLAASGAFGFKRLDGDEAPSKNNTWIYGSENNESKYNITVLDQWYDAREKANSGDNSGHDWTFSPNGGTYQVIFDPANNRTKIVAVGGIDYKGRTYVISGTFNGWIAPADNKANCQFEYQTEGENRGKYVWSYTGLMKNLEFKISDLSNLAEDSDKKWGKAYGTTYTGSTRDQLTAGTETPYQLRRTNVPGEDVLVEDTELYNPTFILDPATMTLTVINNPVTAQYKYGVHSNFADQNSWSCVEMDEHADGSWSYTVAIPKGRRFDIRQAQKNTDITVESNQTARVSSSETTNTSIVEGSETINCVRALVATNHGTQKDGLNWATDNDAFNGTTVYTIVFTPAKKEDGTLKTDGTGTLVIYNNTAVDATIQPAMAENGTDYLIVDGQKANEIVVKVPVANYLGTDAGPFTLSMGDNAIASASKDAEGNVTFEYLPYLSGTREFTLKGADKAVKLNVNSPELADSYFTLGKYKSLTLVANANGYIDVAVACEPTSTLVYDIPVWYYTIGDYTYEAEEVYWSTNGFSFNVKNLAEYDPSTYKAKEEGIATCYGTPIFPFVVRKTAATLAEDTSNLTIQQFGGNKVSFQVKIQVNDGVSGVEGVVIEAEDAPVEYYNLQGQRVNGELAPGIYIRRQGTTVTKVRI